MVKLDIVPPSVFVVTCVTRRPLLSVVNVVGPVTAGTGRLQFLFLNISPVAGVARNPGMPAQQFKTGVPRMVERHLTPPGDGVAVLADVSIFAFMRVVKVMAIHALGSGIIFENIGGMTQIALQSGVPVLKNEFCFFIMIKRKTFPSLCCMTPVALLFAGTVVDIIDQMAGDTGGRSAGVCLVDVTGVAGNLFMFSFQRKPRLAVVKIDVFFPGRFVMTAAAIRPQAPPVRIIIGMAAETIPGCLAKFFMRGMTNIAAAAAMSVRAR